jgi:hypothetical protein
MSSSKRARAPRGGRGTSGNNPSGRGRGGSGDNAPDSGPLGGRSTHSNTLNPDIDPSFQNTVSTSLLVKYASLYYF